MLVMLVRRPSISAALLALLAVPVAALAQRTTVSSGTVLNDVTVVDTVTGNLTPHRALALDHGKIVRIAAAGSLAVSGPAQMVEAKGKYVVPGYLDMHAHVIETADSTPSFFPLLIANGVTGFREESVTPAFTERGKKLDEDIAAGRVEAPEAIFSGTEAHLKPGLSALDSSNAGWPSMDHLGAGWGLLLDCSTDEATLRPASLAVTSRPPFPPNFVLNPRVFDAAQGAPIYQHILDTYSEPKCKALSQVFAKNHTWQTLTLIRLRTQDYGNAPIYRNDPNLKYLDPKTVAVWDGLGDQFAKLPASAVTTLQNYYELQKKVSKLMQQNGVGILAGSDVGGVWLIAGFSLHEEFHELAAAGLTPLEVLQSTTLNAARFLNREATSGTVSEGKNADLVILDANPIADSANLDRISGVVLHGKYLSHEALEKMKADVAAAYAKAS